jgi:molybdopterin-containing oxidoreductase family iron-sulfur binding subunit
MLEHEPMSEPDRAELELDRRAFLKMAGFTFMGAVASGCSRPPVQVAAPPVVQPEAVVPGRSLIYATTCGGCNAGCGLMAKNRDGRPIKLEGNPNHPLSLGGLCATGQASILGLYDSQRLQYPLKNGERATWTSVNDEIRARLDEVRRGNKTVRFLSGTITSPTTRQAIADFLATFPNNQPKHVVHDPLSCSAILDAHQLTHGVRVLPSYRMDRAEVIVSFDADFLGTWITPVGFAAAYQAGRYLQGPAPHLSYHVQFESRMSLTGAKADQRLCVAPGELGLVMTQLAARIAQRAGQNWGGDVPASSVPARFLEDLADRLWRFPGRSLVLCGSQDVGQQLVCNFINDRLQNYGATVDVVHPSYQNQSNDRDLHELRAEIERGDVGALFVYRSNPLFDQPDWEALADRLRALPLLVSFAARRDETANVAGFVCPEPHYLETWNDAEAVDGVVSLFQPTVQRLGDTRPLVETLAVWRGQARLAYDQVRDTWQTRIHPRSLITVSFEAFWNQALHDGFVRVRPQADMVALGVRITRMLAQGPLAAAAAIAGEAEPPPARPLNTAAVAPLRPAEAPAAGTFTLVLYPKVGMLDGSHAYNPWLQELPDPITKVAWDNYVCLSPAAARALRVQQGDVVRIEGVDITLPVLIQQGQHDDVVAVALGYGSKLSERFANIGPPWLEARSTVGANGKVGINAAPMLTWQDNVLRYQRDGVRLTKVNGQHPLACTQDQLGGRLALPLAPAQQRPAPVHDTTLLALRPPAAERPAAERHDLWPNDHQPAAGTPRWGMAIDLSGCTGCSACVIACQVENNIPVVGKDEVRRHREMHWLRIDRYYSAPAVSPVDGAARRETEVNVAHQPMLCQQCGNAPCETVCPVLATVHSEEGLNQQIYNRCVGTRYCANNCPYKVRRFNWFDYAHDDELQNLVLNPDVTVRSRGVMEKCTFCVQRIQEAKIEARRLGRVLADGDIETACQQSCPTKVIVFGDLNDPQSKASQLARSQRAYKVLDELNVQPAISYLSVVRNRPEGGQS